MSHSSHVALDAPGGVKPISQLFERAFAGEVACLPPLVRPPRVRHRLWELPASWHCPLIGTCLTMADLRQIAQRSGIVHADMSDYVLHAVVVDCCSVRCDIAEAIQRFLDQRYAVALRRHARLRGSDTVLAAWRQALGEGDVAGSLWAAWTHPDVREAQGVEIYGDLHMLSHQLAAQDRAGLRRLGVLESENSRLLGERDNLRQKLVLAQREHERNQLTLQQRIGELEQRIARGQHDAAALEGARRAAARSEALREHNAVLERRLEEAARNAAAQTVRIAALERALAGQALCAGDVPASANPGERPGMAGIPEIPAGALVGRRVACIGGRSGMVDHYRRLVEAGGGAFLHHDGGLEENAHRLDAVVASADAVVCQAGHVSHAAYWRIKSACKQRGLPCIFLKTGGLSSFARELAVLAGERALPPPTVNYPFPNYRITS